MIPRVFFVAGILSSALLIAIRKSILTNWVLGVNIALITAGLFWSYWGFGFAAVVLQVYLSGLLVLFAYFVTLGTRE